MEATAQMTKYPGIIVNSIRVSPTETTLMGWSKVSGPRPSIKDLDVHLNKMGHRLPALRGPGIIFGMPGEELGTEITFRGMRYKVEPQYRKLVDTAFLFRHGYTINGSGIVTGRITSMVAGIPQASIWAYPNPETGIPGREEVSSTFEDARRFQRPGLDDKDRGQYIGTVAFGYVVYINSSGRRGVYADCEPERGLKVALLDQDNSVLVKGFTEAELKSLLRIASQQVNDADRARIESVINTMR
jgi:hypothetical protein